MEALELTANTRSSSVKANAVRTAGRIPAIYYGGGKAAVSLDMAYQEFRKVFEKAGENTIINLEISGKKNPVLVHEVQFDPVSDKISHVDFIHVDMDKEVTTSVKLTFIGIAPAIKTLGGMLDVQKHEIKIKCLPKDLIHNVEVDVSGIVDFHTSIHIKDLTLPPTIKVLDNPEDTVVTATPPKKEEETKPAEAVSAEGAAAAEPGTPAEGAAPVAQQAAPAAGKEAKK